ncbi:MAG: tyrosine-type recombinase/integrase [Bdellovibrionota bacterium]|jgi:integrase
MAIRAIKKDGKTVGYDVQVSARHPLTKDRKFLRRRAKNKWEASQLETALKQELHDKINGIEMPTWSELVAAYEAHCLINKAASTRHNELSILGHHANPHLHLKFVDKITEADVREILSRVDSDKSLSLKHNIRKCLANVFSYAIDCRYITDNPCRRVKLQKIPEPTLNILTDEQIKIFLKKAESSGAEWFPIWAIAIYTGLRSGELIALRYRHIDHNAGKPVIKVQESWTKQGGYKPYTKNKRVRTVPINKEVQRIIDQLKAANPNDCGPDDFVLPQIPTWKQGDAAKDLRAFLQGCGLPAIRFHDLRACFISQCLLHGIQPSVVMKMVGHGDMKTMMRYCRHTGSDVIGQTDVLDFS